MAAVGLFSQFYLPTFHVTSKRRLIRVNTCEFRQVLASNMTHLRTNAAPRNVTTFFGGKLGQAGVAVVSVLEVQGKPLRNAGKWLDDLFSPGILHGYFYLCMIMIFFRLVD